MTAVVLDVDDHVARLVLNRPEALNALNGEVREGLLDHLGALRDRPDVAVVVLEGAGRAFSAGADLKEGSGDDGAVDWSERRLLFGRWNRVLDALDSLPQVTVAKLRSHVIGGGSLLAITCDIRIASDDLAVRIPEVAIGLPLTWGGLPRLSREVGLPMARHLVLTGRTMDASAALRCGFVQEVVPAAELDAATEALVAEVAAMPAAALAMSKQMLAAIGRERAGVAGWADADLLMWAGAEPDSRAAAADYAGRRLGGAAQQAPTPTVD